MSKILFRVMILSKKPRLYLPWAAVSIDECYSYYSMDCYPPLPPDFGEIPEFSTIGAALAIVGAGAYILRKKKT